MIIFISCLIKWNVALEDKVSGFLKIIMCLYFSVDDLLKAGINKASHLVIVNRSSNQAREVVLTDADTIVTVQSIFK